MSKKNDGLRPCTECGSDHVNLNQVTLKVDDKENYYIHCNHCGYCTNNLYSKEDLILFWNEKQRRKYDLKPCPFCTSDNLVLKSAYFKPGASVELVWYVKCIDCKAHGGYRSDKAAGLTAWNTRKNVIEHEVTLHEDL